MTVLGLNSNLFQPLGGLAQQQQTAAQYGPFAGGAVQPPGLPDLSFGTSAPNMYDDANYGHASPKAAAAATAGAAPGGPPAPMPGAGMNWQQLLTHFGHLIGTGGQPGAPQPGAQAPVPQPGLLPAPKVDNRIGGLLS